MSELKVKAKELYDETGLDLKRPAIKVPEGVNPDGSFYYSNKPDTSERMVEYGVGTAKDYSTGLYRKAKNYFLGLMGMGCDDPLTRDRVTYQNFKYQISRALEGDDMGLDVYEVPFERLARKNAWGLWRGRKINIPKLRDIPKMLGESYKRLVGRTYRGKALDQQVQGYIELHEKMEAVTKPRNHDLYEATLLRALSDLADEGNPMAAEVYEGAMATYKVRMDNGDSFARDVMRYYNQLEQDVEMMFGPTQKFRSYENFSKN